MGTSGIDKILPREGDDRIWARDGSIDDIVCGPGTDIVYSSDMKDWVDADCESVTRF